MRIFTLARAFVIGVFSELIIVNLRIESKLVFPLALSMFFVGLSEFVSWKDSAPVRELEKVVKELEKR
jgi:ribose/xylose/arabinose/galactoside ABC-type transport system permease subunit